MGTENAGNGSRGWRAGERRTAIKGRWAIRGSRAAGSQGKASRSDSKCSPSTFSVEFDVQPWPSLSLLIYASALLPLPPSRSRTACTASPSIPVRCHSLPRPRGYSNLCCCAIFNPCTLTTGSLALFGPRPSSSVRPYPRVTAHGLTLSLGFSPESTFAQCFSKGTYSPFSHYSSSARP